MPRIALSHSTRYRFDSTVQLGPHLVRLCPVSGGPIPFEHYSLRVQPETHSLHWQQDVFGNRIARVVFGQQAAELSVDVRLETQITSINPFDFLLEPSAQSYPVRYEGRLFADLTPYLQTDAAGLQLQQWLADVDRSPRGTIEFLVGLMRRVQQEIQYLERHEPGVQSPEETLSLARGSCRDSSWLLTQLLRHLGIATRFVSGYLVELATLADTSSGAADPQPASNEDCDSEDRASLHAWVECYLPGAGWIGLDPTSGLLAAGGHLPLARAPYPQAAAPIAGTHAPCDCQFEAQTSVERLSST